MDARHSLSFAHVRAWVFDLDNTLYDPASRLFDQIERRMTSFVMSTLSVEREEADRLRRHYWATYGTTLAGLMHEHALDPNDYLSHVHDISFAALTQDPELRARILDLPGRRIVYTNGTSGYAARVLEARGLSGIFDAVYGVEEADYHAKPARVAFETVFALDGLDTAAGAMFEDDPRNLVAPHAMGMQTVHVAPSPAGGAHIHHHTDDLKGFLDAIAGARGES